MLIGEFDAQLGEKNRIALPKKLRDQMEGLIYLTRGYENCLLMVDTRRWEKLISEINKKALLSLDVRDTKRFILGGASEIELDNQGRFILPESLLDYAGIKNRVTFLGVGEWLEIWEFEKWKAKLEGLSKNVADLAERLH